MPFWEHSLDDGLALLRQAVETHVITSWHAAPLMLRGAGGLIVEVTDGDDDRYRGSFFYDLAKNAVIRLARAQAAELGSRGVTAVALTPGFLRSEAMLEHFGVTEDNWRDGAARDPSLHRLGDPALHRESRRGAGGRSGRGGAQRAVALDLGAHARVRLHRSRRVAARLGQPLRRPRRGLAEMPRPRTVADDVVLDEAMRLIGEVGPAGLTLARIGDAVGLSPATLVQRFGSRRGLLLQVAGRDTDLWPVFARSLARHRSPLAALRAALTDLVAGITSPEVLANHVAFLHLDLTDPVFHELALRHARSRRRSIERLLGAALAAGELDGVRSASARRDPRRDLQRRADHLGDRPAGEPGAPARPPDRPGDRSVPGPLIG